MNKTKKEKLIINRLKELSQTIQKHNFLYHNLDKPKISDREYDILIKENNELEKEYPHLILEKSPNKIISTEENIDILIILISKLFLLLLKKGNFIFVL